MRDIQVAAVGLVGVLAMEGVGQVFEFGLPEANLPERVVGISDNGVVGATLVRFEPYGWGGFVYREGSWSELHPKAGPSRLLGLSADGSVTLSQATWPDGGLFLRGGFGSVTLPTDHAAALSSDGRSVLLASGGGAAGGPLEISRWRDGNISPVLTLPDRYIANPRLLAGGTGDAFVVSADIGVYDAYGQPRRVVRVDGDGLQELGTLASATFVQSTATAMSADASVIAGLESAWDGPDDAGRFNHRAWVWRSGVLSELVVDGFEHLAVRGMSSDGSVLVASGVATDGAYDRLGSVLVHADGRMESVETLLMDAGVSFGVYGYAWADVISADGRTVAGWIARIDAFGEQSFSIFTLTVPGPGGFGLLVGAGLLAARRRR